MISDTIVNTHQHILFISPTQDPFDLSYGGSQRSNLLLQACAACGRVDVICFKDVPSLPDGLGSNIRVVYGQPVDSTKRGGNRWSKFLDLFSAGRIDKYPVHSGKESVIDSFVHREHYDWIVTRYMHEALSMGLLKYADRLVVDIDDSPVDKAKDLAKLVKSGRNKLYHWFYVYATRKALRSFVDKVAVSFFSNRQQAIQYNARLLPNIPFCSIREQDISHDRIHRGRLLFVGLMSYYPNYMGVDRFLTRVYPFLKKKRNLEFHICGKGLEEHYKEKWSSIEGVKVCGFVEDLVQEYAEAELVIIPIYHGGGTCIKVLEAIQMHRLFITTPVGIRGYHDDLTENEDYLLAKDDGSFASLIDAALGDASLQARITEHAAEAVEKSFSKSAVFQAVRVALLS